MIKTTVSMLLGSLLTIAIISGVAHANLLDLYNAVTTGDWEDKSPVAYQVDVKGNDLRVYEWQSALNPNMAVVAIFSKKSAMATSFPVDADLIKKLEEESE